MYWVGYNQINFSNILFTDKNRDTLFISDTILAKISFLAMLRNISPPSSLKMKNGSLVLPDSLLLSIHNFSMEESKFSCLFQLNNKITRDTLGKFSSQGIVNREQSFCKIKVYQETSSKLTLPLWSGATLSMDSMIVSVKLMPSPKDVKRTETALNFYNFKIFNKHLSSQECVFEKIQYLLNVHLNHNTLYIENPSWIKINDITFNLTGEIKKEPALQIKTTIQTEQLPAGKFFNSLPVGLFSVSRSTKAEGLLNYFLRIGLDLSHTDSLLFESELKKENFRIKNFGKANFPSLNEPFYYTGHSKGFPDRKILVGQENPDFVSLENISNYLKNAVLISEDGSFFFHDGFNEDAFRQSIITNLKNKKFQRGGSTITMQLVKNIYLSREKTISRKLEEILLVWLLENSHAVSKERLYEIYLNIIEWGPDVFGISEASKFYFSKKPINLNLQESLFLSSIIPRPKNFKYYFDKKGMLREFLKEYYAFVSEKLLIKELITSAEFENLKPEIKLTGPAKFLVMPQDSLPLDSLND
ncbi:MAG: hypothetical protein A3H98_03370 [Bacteroidetes bacterium RIFCSPLOWO2_02_FULL_36_8]|nr:MAG: hypothetical protein A3H98_03370 [Bacteroidetes bacterium RIFCSPLOWO2_02_FULL_36_8]OFY69483.1 MAG: hypothetical protein A3G23_10615 [Bacteroidetes bacterium RIFCSPLOWO2_12_FULL_37_12]